MKIELTKKQIEKVILSVIGILVIISIVNNMFLKSMNNELKNKKQQILNLKMQYADNLMKMVELENMRLQLKEIEKDYQEKKKIFISETEKKYLIEKITEYGKKWGLNFKSINFTEEKRDINNNFIITMYIRSNYEQLVNYLYNIEEIDKQIKIKNIKINKTENTINAIIEFKSIIIKEVKNLGEK